MPKEAEPGETWEDTGERRNRLFITATHALYSVFVAARGAQRP